MLLQAGLDGIRRELPLCPAVDLNLYDADPGVLEKNARSAGELGGSGLAGEEQCVCPKRVAGKNAGKLLRVKLEDWKRCREAEDQAAANESCILPPSDRRASNPIL